MWDECVPSQAKVVPNVKTKNQQKQEPKAPSVSIGAVSTKGVRGPAVGGVENGGNCGSLQLSPFSTPQGPYARCRLLSGGRLLEFPSSFRV